MQEIGLLQRSGTVAYPNHALAPAAGGLSGITVVRGHAQVLAYHQMLSALAERCGQPEAVVHLPFFLSACRFGAKIPSLVLHADSTGTLRGAALLYEYGMWGVSTGIVIPADSDGQRGIIAPEGTRSAIALKTAEILMERGSLLVLLSLANGEFRGRQLRARTSATQTRTIVRSLPLRTTFDETLAGMGTRTRRNLRHYRRRAIQELGAAFVPQAGLSEAEFVALSRRCFYPVPDAVSRWRYTSAHEASGIFAGLRGADGQWLALIGGRRHNGTTFVDWQVNIDSLPAYSLGTAMRAFFLQHEIDRGTQTLTFEGGTPHSMHRAFISEPVSDLLLIRSFLAPLWMRRLIARIFRKTSFLGETLLAGTLEWHRKS